MGNCHHTVRARARYCSKHQKSEQRLAQLRATGKKKRHRSCATVMKKKSRHVTLLKDSYPKSPNVIASPKTIKEALTKQIGVIL